MIIVTNAAQTQLNPFEANHRSATTKPAAFGPFDARFSRCGRAAVAYQVGL